MFLHSGSSKLNNYSIYSNWCLTLYHVPLTITIPIIEESINSTKCSIIKDSNEKAAFIKNVFISIRNLNMSNLSDITSLDNIINEFTNKVKSTWKKNSKIINIIRHFKSWWNKDCNRNLVNYRSSKNLEDWKIFQKMVKNIKCAFFNLKIQEIANKKQGPWKLMN